MKKLEILKMIGQGALGIASTVDPRIGMVEKGVEHLMKRDADPTNDAEETAAALTDVVLNGIGMAEDFSGHEFFNNELGAQLAANIKGDILLALKVFKHQKINPPA